MDRNVRFDDWDFQEFQQIRLENGFLAADPYWAYLYILHVQEKSDLELEMPQDLTAIYYSDPTTCREESIESREVWIEELVSEVGGKNLTTMVLKTEAIAVSEKTYPDFVFPISFGQDVHGCLEHNILAHEITERLGIRVAFGVNAFAAIQLLEYEPGSNSIDNRLSSLFEKTPAPSSKSYVA